MRIQITMTLPNQAASVPLARHTVSAALEDAGVTPDSVHEVAVALTEACANVIRHAAESDDYDVVIDLSDARLAVDVIDTGSGFARRPAGAPPSMPEAFAEEGRGAALMHALTDMTVFDHVSGEGGSVHMVKQLHWAQDAPFAVATGRRRQRPAGDQTAHHRDRGDQERAQAAGERSRLGNQRNHIAEERDHVADERNHVADERNHVANERDRIAAERFAQLRRGLAVTDSEARAERERAAQMRQAMTRQRLQGASERDAAAAERDRVEEARHRAAQQRARAAEARLQRGIVDPQADRRDAEADRRDAEADRRDREADRRDREADRRDREADLSDERANQLEAAGEAILREVALFEADEGIRLLVERADRRDQQAEQRDRLARHRDAAAQERPEDTEQAAADRARAASNREASAEDRDEAAGDRADLRTAFKEHTRQRPPIGTPPPEAAPEADADHKVHTESTDD